MRKVWRPVRTGIIVWLAVMTATASAVGAQDLRVRAFAELWNEHADRAVDLFETWYREHPDDADPGTRRGYALALSWFGLQGRAAEIYAQLAADDPTDAEARVGLARCRIWSQEMRAGWAGLRAVEDDADLAPHQRREAGSFALRVLDEYLVPGEIAWRGNWDSDDLTTHRLRALGAVTAPGGLLVQAGPRLSLYSQPGRPDATAAGLQVHVEKGLTPHLSLHATGWYDHFSSDDVLAETGRKLDWNRPGADGWLTWQPTSRLRFDGGAASMPVETYLAFGKELGFEQENLSCDWRFARWFSAGASGTRATYSDGNRRLQGSINTTWHHEGAVDLDVTASFTHSDFTLPYPGGYWAPDWVRNGSLSARAKWWGRRWTVTLDGSLGREKETGADAITVGGASGRLGLRVSRNWLVALEAGHSRSAFATSSGYRRTFVGLSWRGVF